MSKLRVYTDLNQDDAGPWLRREFPHAAVQIATPGDHVDYHDATWTDIAGDRFYKERAGRGLDDGVGSVAERAHCAARGPLGAYFYPLPCCIAIEGDTPSVSEFDRQRPCGLHESEDFGGWGGRYVWRQPWLETRPYWIDARRSRDTVTGVDGKSYTSNQATIWRVAPGLHCTTSRRGWHGRVKRRRRSESQSGCRGERREGQGAARDRCERSARR